MKNNYSNFGRVSLCWVEHIYNNLTEETKEALSDSKHLFKIPRRAFRTILFAAGFNMKQYHQTKGIVRCNTIKYNAKETVIFTADLRGDVSKEIKQLYSKGLILSAFTPDQADIKIQEIGNSFYKTIEQQVHSDKEGLDLVEEEFDKEFPKAKKIFKTLEQKSKEI